MSKWTSLSIVWVVVAAILGASVVIQGTLPWWALIFPSILTFCGILGDMSNAR